MPSTVKTHAHWTRSFLLWSGAILFSLILNLAMFGLMPGLSTGVAEHPGKTEPLRMIDVVRIKRAEPPPPTPKKPTPKPETMANHQGAVAKVPAPVHPAIDKLPRLDFDINPRLPAGPLVLPSPAMETVTFGVPAMDGIFSIGDLDAPLTPLVNIPPMFPLRAKRRGIEGWVKVKFLVTRKGLVENIEIIDAYPPGIFDQSAVRAVSAYRFKPGTVEGVPVTSWLEQTIRFELTQ